MPSLEEQIEESKKEIAHFNKTYGEHSFSPSEEKTDDKLRLCLYSYALLRRENLGKEDPYHRRKVSQWATKLTRLILEGHLKSQFNIWQVCKTWEKEI